MGQGPRRTKTVMLRAPGALGPGAPHCGLLGILFTRTLPGVPTPREWTVTLRDEIRPATPA